MPIFISGSHDAQTGFGGETVLSHTGAVGNNFKRPILIYENKILSASEGGTIFSVQGGQASHFTMSFPVPTASLEGCHYTFIFTGTNGLTKPCCFSSSRDPVGAELPSVGLPGTGAFVGRVWTGDSGNITTGIINFINDQANIPGHNMVKFRKQVQGYGTTHGDRYEVTCIKYSTNPGADDTDACAWYVQGWAATSSAVTGTDENIEWWDTKIYPD